MFECLADCCGVADRGARMAGVLGRNDATGWSRFFRDRVMGMLLAAVSVFSPQGFPQHFY